MNYLVLLSSFLAAAVEWVEAFTIVLAVGLYRGWRSAFAGTVLAGLALVLLVAFFGFAVTTYVSVELARTIVGIFLLLFGLKWLHKAIQRSSGLKALHDEEKAFEETKEQLAGHRTKRGQLDWVGLTTAFNGVFLEGLEVVFIVIALGGLNSLQAASAGAAGSAVVVIVAGFALRHPLTRVPENAMKYVVGIMLTAFGTFFTGEGIGVTWWRDDLSLVPLIAFYAAASFGLVQLLKNPPAILEPEARLVKAIRSVVNEIWGLFIGDGALATVCVAAVLAVTVFGDRAGNHSLASVLLVAGVSLAMLVGLAGSFRESRARRPAGGATEKVPSSLPEADLAASELLSR